MSNKKSSHVLMLADGSHGTEVLLSIISDLIECALFICRLY